MAKSLTASDERALVRARIRYLLDEVEAEINVRIYGYYTRKDTHRSVAAVIERLGFGSKTGGKRAGKRPVDPPGGEDPHENDGPGTPDEQAVTGGAEPWARLPKGLHFSEVFKFFLNVCRELELAPPEVMDTLEKDVFLRLLRLRNRASHDDPDAEELCEEDYEECKRLVRRQEFPRYLSISFDRAAMTAARLILGDAPPWDMEGDVRHERVDAVPNNLPKVADHDGTGLIGRAEMSQCLKQFIGDPGKKLLSVAAIGGAGKSALVIDFLKGIRRHFGEAAGFDAVLFHSFKEGRRAGEEAGTGPAGMVYADLERAISRELRGMLSLGGGDGSLAELSGKRVILCLDSVESLLTDGADGFKTFCSESIPKSWKTIVTSRIPLGGDLWLEPMGKESMRALAEKILLQYRSVLRSETLVSRAVAAANGIPLLLRYYIEMVERGYELDEAKIKTQSDALRFCFDHLSECLGKNEKLLMAAVHELRFQLQSKQDERAHLCGLLGVSEDEFREEFVRLQRAALMTRAHEGAKTVYQVSENVRDYIEGSPAFKAVRAQVLEMDRLSRARARSAITVSAPVASPFDPEYIPEDTVETLMPELANVNDRIRTRELGYLLEKSCKWFSEHRAPYERSAIYFYYFGRIYEHKDEPEWNQAIEHYRRAAQLGPADPRPPLALGHALLKRDRYEEARESLEPMWMKGYGRPEKSSPQYARRLTEYYVRVLLNLGDFERVAELTEKWQKTFQRHPDLGVQLGLGRAALCTRLAQTVSLCAEKRLEHLSSARGLLGALLEAGVKPGDLARESNRFIITVTSVLKRHPELQAARELLGFHIAAIKEAIPLDSKSLKFISQQDSPLGDPGVARSSEEELARRGYCRVRVTHTADGFVIATDADDERHFVRRSMYFPQSPVSWEDLQIGSELWVLSVDGKSANNPARYFVIAASGRSIREAVPARC